MSERDDGDASIASSPVAPPIASTRMPETLGEDPRDVDTLGEGARATPSDVPARAGRADHTRYRPDAVLGTGGMGEVRLCHDEVIGRAVALKRMRDDVPARSRARVRFAREALVQARLEHPSIVPVYDVGLGDDDTGPWFTMKRIRGRSLESILASAREGDTASLPSRRKLLTALVQVCLAVDYAHGRGVIHRDLKPGNVMLGEFGEVHLIDWGLAKVRGESTEEPLHLTSSEDDATMTGSLMGTPGYMSPEQARGASDELGPRADVYALGAILFELLTLEPLITGPNTISLLSATMKGIPRSRFDREDLPPELAEACARATAQELEDRLPSARALAELVERYLDGDRDVELRARLASQHFERAKAQLTGGETVRGESARAEALRELGRVVALDPTNAEALDLMTHLLVEPSEGRAVPPEVEPELARARDEERQRAAGSAARRFALWCVFVPVIALLGVRSVPGMLAIGALVGGAALTAAWIARTRSTSVALRGVLFVTSTLAIACTAGIFGPFVLVPGLAATNTMFFALHAEVRHRPWVVAAGVLAVLAPFALDVLGITPPAYSYSSRGLLVEERVAELPELTTTITLLATSTLLVVVPTMLIARMRDALAAAERRLTTQAWRLRQMLPASTRELLARRTRRPSA